MSDIKIHYFRLTFLWVETLPELLESEAAPEGSMDFLWAPKTYASRFVSILKSSPDELGLQPPWRRPAGEFFWTYYLENMTPGEISGETAWRFLVPFRGKVPVRIEASWLPQESLVPEAFFYPHGVAVALTARVQSTFSLEEAVASAHALRSGKKLNVVWLGESKEKSETLNLDAFSRKALQALRRTVLGSKAKSASQPLPFTIGTVVQAEGVDAAAPLAEGSEVHRLLQALTAWSPTWKSDNLRKLEEARLPTRNNPQNGALYAGSRGRAVWFPGHYTADQPQRRSLSCYHRNLVVLSLQVESLADLVALTAKRLQEGSVPSPKHRDLARRAVGILGRLYGGVKTYRSRSPRLQLDQNDWVTPINVVRDYFDMQPLQ